MLSKQTGDSTRNRPNIGRVAMVFVISTVLSGCQLQHAKEAKIRQALDPGVRSLEVMPASLEAAVKESVDPNTNAIITLGPGGQERTFVTSDRVDEHGNVIFEEFPIPADQINGIIITNSGVVYLLYEGSPDKQSQCFPGDGCVPVSHTH